MIIHLGTFEGTSTTPYPAITASELNAEANTSVVLYPEQHGPPTFQVQDWVTIPDLLAAEPLGFNAATLTSVEVVGSGVPPVVSTLTQADFALEFPPVLYTGTVTNSIFFARGPRDSNDNYGVDDTINSLPNGPIDVYVPAPKPSPVTVKASTTSPKANASVTFTASAPGVTHPMYSWHFPDNSTVAKSATATITHPITVSGDVTVMMTGDGAASGTGHVTVKIPVKTSGGTTKPGTGKSTSPKAPSVGPSTGNGSRIGASPGNQTTNSVAQQQGASASSGQEPSQSQVNADAFSNLPLVTGRLISGTATVANLDVVGAKTAATAPASHVPAKWRLPLTVFVYALGALLLFGGAFSELRVYFRRTKA